MKAKTTRYIIEDEEGWFLGKHGAWIDETTDLYEGEIEHRKKQMIYPFALLLSLAMRTQGLKVQIKCQTPKNPQRKKTRRKHNTLRK